MVFKADLITIGQQVLIIIGLAKKLQLDCAT